MIHIKEKNGKKEIILDGRSVTDKCLGYKIVSNPGESATVELVLHDELELETDGEIKISKQKF